MNTPSKETLISDEVDVSKLISLEEQKECCEKMLDQILDIEYNLNYRLMSIQTINDAVQSDDHLINSLGEFLGYQYGKMNSSKNMVNTALINLNRFMEGGLDEIDHGARGMFLNVWYNLGVAGLVDLEEILSDLEKMEMDIIETASEKGNGIITRETIH